MVEEGIRSMEKTQRRLLFTLIGFAAILITFNAVAHLSGSNRQQQTAKQEVQNQQQESLSYKGKDGKDALSLLKERATIVQDKSGLVTVINGRKSDNTKREYWAFYVNSKMALVGPLEYRTKDTDVIEWKIETY